jgi:hypothetical protein
MLSQIPLVPPSLCSYVRRCWGSVALLLAIANAAVVDWLMLPQQLCQPLLG